ncbi:DUF393 domain-containing protein [Marinobacter hydrocarbonoclasticus]|nr:DUF393 domain-containing protein [Marinobacter nauticus]
MPRLGNAIILFDGVCNLCNASVRFVAARDPSARYQFAPLQSRTARGLLADYPLPERGDSVILIQDGKAYQKSEAALRIARHLSGLWPLLAVCLVIPRPIRDGVYDVIGRRRYRWFGRTDTCLLPSDALKSRFLDWGDEEPG